MLEVEQGRRQQVAMVGMGGMESHLLSLMVMPVKLSFKPSVAEAELEAVPVVVEQAVAVEELATLVPTHQALRLGTAAIPLSKVKTKETA